MYISHKRIREKVAMSSLLVSGWGPLLQIQYMPEVPKNTKYERKKTHGSKYLSVQFHPFPLRRHFSWTLSLWYCRNLIQHGQ